MYIKRNKNRIDISAFFNDRQGNHGLTQSSDDLVPAEERRKIIKRGKNGTTRKGKNEEKSLALGGLRGEEERWFGK